MYGLRTYPDSVVGTTVLYCVTTVCQDAASFTCARSTMEMYSSLWRIARHRRWRVDCGGTFGLSRIPVSSTSVRVGMTVCVFPEMVTEHEIDSGDRVTGSTPSTTVTHN